MIDLAIVIVNFNTKDLTLKCLKSIFKRQLRHKFKVWVVDNASGDGSIDSIKKNFPYIEIIESNKNLGFAKGNNLVLKKVESEYSLLLNSDTEVKEGALDSLMDFAIRNDFAISSCKLINGDGSFQSNAGELPTPKNLFVWLSGLDDLFRKIWPILSYQERDRSYYHNGRAVGWVGGTAMLIRNDVFKKIGYLDENIFMYGEDVEFCLRAQKAGFKVGWTEEAEIIHLGGGSFESPKYNQWKGEFRGLLYIYNLYYGLLAMIGLKLLFYIFITIRVLGFLILGKINYSKTYAKILINF